MSCLGDKLVEQLQRRLEAIVSMEYVQDWKKKATVGRFYWVHTAKLRKDSLSGWPSTKAKDGREWSPNAKAENASGHGLGAVSQLVACSTPRATDGENGGPNQTGGALPADAATAGWATPRASDFKFPPTVAENNDTLPLPLATAGWPTPAVQNAESGPNPSGKMGDWFTLQTAVSLTSESRGVLNPDHSRWLMGYPVEWGASGSVAICSLLKSRRRKRKHMVPSGVIVFVDDRLSVTFRQFDLEEYRLFLRLKALPESDITYNDLEETYTITAPARFANLVGAEAPPPPPDPLPFGPHLFDDQVFVTRRFLETKRFGCYMQCGLGKTVIGLESARQVFHLTRGRILFVTLNEIVHQWQEEAEKFYPDDPTMRLTRLNSRQEMRQWMRSGSPGLYIVNYEKFNPAGEDDLKINEASGVTCVILDEGSRLRTQGGRQKWALLKSFDSTEYKLVLSATPAPNELFEFASQAGFLNKFRSESSINAFFSRDPKTQKWMVKPHARKALFRWMSSWSIYINDPKRYGWRAGFPNVPHPDYRTIEIEATGEQLVAARLATKDAETGQLTLVPDGKLGIVQRSKLSQVAKGFRYVKHNGKRIIQRVDSNKPGAVARIVAEELRNKAQIIVWTVFDAESSILADTFKTAGIPHTLLVGSTPEHQRERILHDFRHGKIDVLISRASVVGFGLNFQFVTVNVVAGWDDSFERLYQLVRRSVRYGQNETVRIYFPIIRELEGEVFDNVWSKHDEFEQSIREMEDAYLEAEQTMRGAA